jgi:hypothetical protein
MTGFWDNNPSVVPSNSTRSVEEFLPGQIEEENDIATEQKRSRRRNSMVSFAIPQTSGKQQQYNRHYDHHVDNGQDEKVMTMKGSTDTNINRTTLASRLSVKKSVIIKIDNDDNYDFDSNNNDNEENEDKEMRKNLLFRLVTIVLPLVLSLWYSAAILFPPGVTEKYSYLLWDDGQLIINDEGQPSICPRASICSKGYTQVVLISISRLTAFASYAVMGVTFLSKMHFLIHFLSSSYIRTFVPFESLHHVHTNTGKIFAGLAFVHTITHYIRYILRRDVHQLGTQVHVSGLFGILSMSIVIISMSSIAKSERFKNNVGKFEKRLNCHWMFIILCMALCAHNGRTRVITLAFL